MVDYEHYLFLFAKKFYLNKLHAHLQQAPKALSVINYGIEQNLASSSSVVRSSCGKILTIFVLSFPK